MNNTTASIQLDGFEINETSPVYIIAEAGVNHNGSLDLAIQLVDAAKEAGVNCVKFQTFKAENLVTKQAPKANYQLQVTDPKESQFDMLKKLELKPEEYVTLIEHCRKKEITFLSTPYNFEDVDLLCKLGVSGFKIASGQLVESPILKYIAKTKKPMIVSTGMSYLSDVDTAVRAIRSENNDQIILLQCTTNYPTGIEEANLNAMLSMKTATQCIVGYSDHTVDSLAILASVAMGAKVIEKHFTLDKKMAGPDHSSSADPKEFTDLVRQIRAVEIALGNGIKTPGLKESKNITGMRRSLVAKNAIMRGQTIRETDLAFKRPATGIPPNFYDQIIGMKANRDIQADELLQFDCIDWKK